MSGTTYLDCTQDGEKVGRFNRWRPKPASTGNGKGHMHEVLQGTYIKYFESSAESLWFSLNLHSRAVPLRRRQIGHLKVGTLLSTKPGERKSSYAREVT